MAYKIDNYFFNTFGDNFVDFHQKNLAGKSYFTGVSVSEGRFMDFWSEQNLRTAFGRSEINIVEFLTLHNIIVKETGGQYARGGETVNGMAKANPGIGYLFDRIGNKMSYNTALKAMGNKSCQTLFMDADYIDAHSTKPLGDLLAGKDDSRWGGNIFPYGFENMDNYTLCSTKEQRNGFILQADFFKFRGRGFIQTTGRGNYKAIVKYILNYTGSNPIVLKYKKRWSESPFSSNLDKICTRSTNGDWDELFADMEVGAKAISIHASGSGNYLNIPLENVDGKKLNQLIYNAAHGVNKNPEYGNLIVNRVLQTIQALGL